MSEPKRPGRPPLTPGDTTTPVMVRVPSAMYDQACKVASEKRINVPEVIRQALTAEFRNLK